MFKFIDEFVRRYVREQDFYARVSEICGRQAERLLKDHSVRAITTWRAKRPDRLQRKLEERNRRRVDSGKEGYHGEREIYEDIPDLAGVRIALYFPGDRARVATLIRERFVLIVERSFPLPSSELSVENILRRKHKRFAGYGATHYRVQLREDGLGADEKRYAEGRCEIQVASVLMHAWSEVEHDLEYKDLSGEVSPTESSLLDQINGLVMAGEIALEQLQLATYQRSTSGGPGDPGGTKEKRIRDQYDLANWLAGVRETLSDASRQKVDIGRADIVFRLLEITEATKFSELEKYRDYMVNQTSDGAMAQRLLEAILVADPKKSTALQRAKLEIAAADADTIASTDFPLESTVLGQFLAKWRELEVVLQQVMSRFAPSSRLYPLRQSLDVLINEDSRSTAVVRRLFELRNQAIHWSDRRPTLGELYDGIAAIDQLIRELPNDAKDVTRRGLLQEAITNVFGAPHRKKYADGEIIVAAQPLMLLEELEGLIVVCTIENTSSQSDVIAEVHLRAGGRRMPPSDISGLWDHMPHFVSPGNVYKLPGREILVTGCYFRDVSVAEVRQLAATGLVLEVAFAAAGTISVQLTISEFS